MGLPTIFSSNGSSNGARAFDPAMTEASAASGVAGLSALYWTADVSTCALMNPYIYAAMKTSTPARIRALAAAPIPDEKIPRLIPNIPSSPTLAISEKLPPRGAPTLVTETTTEKPSTEARLGVFRRPVSSPLAPASSSPVETAHTLVVVADLATPTLVTPLASISPVPRATQRVVLLLSLDVTHPLLPAATLSCWHHSCARELVIVASPRSPASTASPQHFTEDIQSAADILERRSFWRYQPPLGILESALSSFDLSLPANGGGKITLVGMGGVPAKVLGFTEDIEGAELERAVEARSRRRFKNLAVKCVGVEKYAEMVGPERFALEAVM